ncbi:MAG: peptidase [Gemmatimonadetes bacterium]|nr:peptidase [Gemmatimonadota bacterium]
MRRWIWTMVAALSVACGSTPERPPEDTEAAAPADTVRRPVPGLPPAALSPGVTPAEMEAKVAQFAPVELGFDASLLDAEQRIVARKLVEASRLLDEIFLLQVWRDNPAYADKVAAAEGAGMDAARVYYAIMYGPWDRLEDDQPFLLVGPKPPGAGYYPRGATRAEIESWIEEHPDDREAFTSYYTVIVRTRDGELRAIPYSEAYADRLKKAAALLREAADHAGNASLSEFLRERAEAFETNDYLASEIAWINLEGNLIEPTIGPYEVYEDALMGWKAAFESFVTIKDPEASAELEILVSRLPELEAALPMDEIYKDLDKSFASPLSVVDVIYTAGDTRAGVQTLAFNLPNDPRITQEHGTKKVMLRNVIDAKFEKILAPIGERVLVASLVDDLGARAFTTFVVMHELAHGLGPRLVHGTDTRVSVALGPAYSAIEEAKADVVGVLSLAKLSDDGLYSAEFERQVYVSSVASLFRCVRFGTGEAHGKGCAVQMNALLDAGALAVDEGGRFAIDFSRIPGAYRDLASRLLAIEATGDAEAARALLEAMGSLPEAGEAALGRLDDVPVDIRPIYTVEETMEGW